MTPTLYDVPNITHRMMGRGAFTLWHGWNLDHGFKLEYWRGTEGNGACLRALHDDEAVSITHYAQPGAALLALQAGGYPVPGVPA